MPCTIFIDLFKAVGRGRRFWFFGFNSPSTTFPFLPSEPPSQRFIFRNYGRVAVVQPIIVKEVVCIPLCVETCRINPLELVWNESDDIPILTAQNLLHWLVRGIFRHWWVARYTAVVIHESNQLYIIRGTHRTWAKISSSFHDVGFSSSPKGFAFGFHLRYCFLVNSSKFWRLQSTLNLKELRYHSIRW